MRFLVDAQLPPGLAAWLRAKGHDATTVRDLGLRDAPDPEIWQRAHENGQIIVTKDEDFAALAASKGEGPCVLWVRCGNLVNRLLLASFERAWPQIEEHFSAGARVVEIR